MSVCSWKQHSTKAAAAAMAYYGDYVYRCRLSYYAVFDGHGGSRASKYAAQHLHKIIADKFPKGNVAWTRSIVCVCCFISKPAR